MIKVGFKKLTDDAILPVKAHPTDSGFDLFANEDVIIEPGRTEVIKTGVAIKLPPGYEGQVRPRSGVTSKTHLRVQLGTIDNDYTGEVGIIVDNITQINTPKEGYLKQIDGSDYERFIEVCEFNTYKINKGDKLAQLVIVPIPAVEVYEFTDTPTTTRGANGFGSSGY